MKYKIIHSDGINQKITNFEEKVNEYLETGWVPKGGVILLPVGRETESPQRYQYLQTIWKPNKVN